MLSGERRWVGGVWPLKTPARAKLERGTLENLVKLLGRASPLHERYDQRDGRNLGERNYPMRLKR